MPGSLDHIPWENLYLLIIVLSVKQNLSYAWFLRPSALGKLTHSDIYQNIKQNIGRAWILGPHTLGKLILFNYCSKC